MLDDVGEKKSVDVVVGAESGSVVAENGNAMVIKNDMSKKVETSEKKRKKEEEEAMSTSPKKKKAKIDVPIVDSNNAEEVNRLTEICLEFVNLSRRDNLTEDIQLRLSKTCITLNLQTPTYGMLKATGVGLAVRKLRKSESISESLRTLLNGIYKR